MTCHDPSILLNLERLSHLPKVLGRDTTEISFLDIRELYLPIWVNCDQGERTEKKFVEFLSLSFGLLVRHRGCGVCPRLPGHSELYLIMPLEDWPQLWGEGFD
jgi:hypothetical protein